MTGPTLHPVKTFNLHVFEFHGLERGNGERKDMVREKDSSNGEE